MLGEKDLVSYLKTHALMYEYYRQTQEIVPPHISTALHRLFTSEAYQIVNTRYVFSVHVTLLISNLLMSGTIYLIAEHDIFRCIFHSKLFYAQTYILYLILEFQLF